MSIGLVTVQKGKSGPVVHMWIDGKEVGQVELTTRAAANLISNLADNLEREIPHDKS